MLTAKKSWKHISNTAKKGSFTGRLASRLKQTNQKADVFVVADASKFKQKKNGPQLRYAMIELGLKTGLAARIKMELTSKSEAVQALSELEVARPNALSLTTLMGFPGVVQNLTMTQKGKYITAKTSASSAETSRIIGLVQSKTPR